MPNKTEIDVAAIDDILSRFAPKRQTKVRVTRETRLREDLEIDSPRMIDIVLDVEDRFGITLEDADVQDAQTVGDILDLVERRTARK